MFTSLYHIILYYIILHTVPQVLHGWQRAVASDSKRADMYVYKYMYYIYIYIYIYVFIGAAREGRAHPKVQNSGRTTCLRPLVYHRCSSTVVNNVAT